MLIATVTLGSLYSVVLIVGFLLYPTTWITSEYKSTRFVIDKDCDWEWDSWNPPINPENDNNSISLTVKERSGEVC